MSKSKAALKNSLFMYVRTGLQMLITLYSVRILLASLGVFDYGLYNTIGSIVVLCSFLTSALANSTQRFISFELGNNNMQKLALVYYGSLKIHRYLSLLIVAICEVVGLVFIYNYMNVPQDRLVEMSLVLQFSILVFVYNILIVPYRAILTAYERFDWISILTIVESILKLTIAYLISCFSSNRIILYALFFLLITMIIFHLYQFGSRKYTVILKPFSGIDVLVLKKMVSFGGWNFLGGIGQVTMNQLSNMMINVFCGPLVNAAQAIATQVNSYVNKFIQDFLSAIQPQIVKSFASNDDSYLRKVVFSGMKLSFFLIVAVAVPIAFNIEFILTLWLKEYPDFVPVFIKLLLVNSAIVAATGTLSTLIESNGNIKWTQISYTIVLISCTLLSYFGLKFTHDANWIYYSLILSSVLCLLVRVYFAKKFGLICLSDYLLLFVKCFIPYTVVYLALYYVLSMFLNNSGILYLGCSILLAILFLPSYGYYIFLNSVEQNFVKNIVSTLLSKYRSKQYK